MSIRMYDWARGDFVSDKNQLDRIEDLLTQLIGNVANVRSGMNEIRSEVETLRNDVGDFRNKMNIFRHETNERLDGVERSQQELSGQVRTG